MTNPDPYMEGSIMPAFVIGLSVVAVVLVVLVSCAGGA